MKNVKTGLFGIGLDTYWPQFFGLEARLRGYVAPLRGRRRHVAGKLDKLVRRLGLPTVRVC